MEGYLNEIKSLIKEVQSDADFSMGDLFAVLQGITGFASAATNVDPAGMINSVLGIFEIAATKCNLGTLRENKDKLQKWLTFGMEYRALDDPSDLDFDKMDVGSVPEVMEVTQDHNILGICSMQAENVYLKKLYYL